MTRRAGILLALVLCGAGAFLLLHQPGPASSRNAWIAQGRGSQPAPEKHSGRTYKPHRVHRRHQGDLRGHGPFPRVTVPAVGITAHVQPIVRDSSGALKPPDNYHEAGWYAEGPQPGDAGAVILAGHVDSGGDTGVFWNLRAVKKNDLIGVTDASGDFFVYKTVAVRSYPKARFPTGLVYPNTQQPLLRLITCGGAFDSLTGHYVDNVIVFAQLIGQPAFFIHENAPQPKE